MDVNSLGAVGRYAALRPATEPFPDSGGAAERISGFAREFAATLQEGEFQAKAAMAGQADPHALVMALTQSELAVETAITVRNRVVEAYQEILRMPV